MKINSNDPLNLNNINFQIEQLKIKKCNKCRLSKTIKNFYKKGNGYRSNCKKCEYERVRKYKKLEKHKERHVEQVRLRNATREGKELLKIRNRRAYLKRQRRIIHIMLNNFKSNLFIN